MALTLEAVQKRSTTSTGPLDMESLALCLSHGSLMGARGNSGVILSQILRGLAGAFASAGTIGPVEVAEAFSRASEAPTPPSATRSKAPSSPWPGPPPGSGAQAQRAGQAAEAAAPGGPGAPGAGRGGAVLVEVLEGAREAAARALDGTTQQLPALRAAGRGGRRRRRACCCCSTASFTWWPAGRSRPLRHQRGRRLWARPGPGRLKRVGGPGSTAPPATARRRRGCGRAALRGHVFPGGAGRALPAFRSVWEGCGGSIVIVGGDGLYNCHIHTDDVGEAIEAAIEIGRPRQIRVTDLRDQVEEERWVRDAAASGGQLEAPEEPVNCAVVAVCAGDGVKRILRSLGARRLVSGGQSANPSTAEILEAIAAVPAEQVIVLPNNVNVVAVAEQAAAHSQKKVRVVPTPGMPEGFAALLGL